MGHSDTDPPQFKETSSRKFLEEWQSLRGAEHLTSWDALSAGLSGESMLQMFINERVASDLTIRFMGSELVAIWGSDMTGLSASAAAGPDFAQDLISRSDHMLSQPCGSLEYVWSTTASSKRILTEGVYLPLAVKDGRPKRIAGHIAFIEKPQQDFDNPTRIDIPHKTEWIDLGFGVPAN